MVQRNRQFVLTALAVVGGLALFVYAARRVGVDQIVDGIRRVGWGMLPILTLGGVRFALRAEAWRRCAPRAGRLAFGDALAAFLAGDALGNITPFGLLASEPTKVYLTRHHLDTGEAIASLAIDNLVYVATVGFTIALAVVVLLLSVPLSLAWREWSVVLLAGLLVLVLGGVWLLRHGLGGRTPNALRSLTTARQAILDRTAGNPLRLWRVACLDVGFHALAVLEAYLVLGWLLGTTSPTLTQAFLFSALDRVLNVLFKFVPFRVGVDEVASGALAPVLAVTAAAGVSLAIVRKVRNLFWAGVGLLIIGVHHGRAAKATDPHGNAPARRS